VEERRARCGTVGAPLRQPRAGAGRRHRPATAALLRQPLPPAWSWRPSSRGVGRGRLVASSSPAARAARIDRPQPVPPGGGEKKWRGRDHPAASFSDYLMAGASGFLGF